MLQLLHRRRPSRNVNATRTVEDVHDFHVETLETRTLLAGQVTATLANGILTVNGDNSDNYIDISTAFEVEAGADGSGGGAGGVSQQVLRLEGFDDTQIEFNGEISSEHFIFLGEDGLRDIRVNMRGGDDELTIGGGTIQRGPSFQSFLEVDRDIRVNMGSGNDYVDLFHVDVNRNVRVQGGSGNDYVYMDSFYVGNDLRVQLGSGNTDGEDKFFDGQFVLVDSGYVDGKVTIQGGNTDDLILLGPEPSDIEAFGGNGFYGLSIGEKLTVKTCNGDDAIFMNEVTVGFDKGDESSGDLSINTGSGDDVLGMQRVGVGGRSKVNTGSGDDVVGMERVGFGQLAVVGGGGNDTLVLDGDGFFFDDDNGDKDNGDKIEINGVGEFERGFVPGDIRFTGGGGNDYLAITDAEFPGTVTAILGGGNDAIAAFNVYFDDTNTYNGGGGTDYAAGEDLFGVPSTLVSIEIEGLPDDFESRLFDAFWQLGVGLPV